MNSGWIFTRVWIWFDFWFQKKRRKMIDFNDVKIGQKFVFAFDIKGDGKYYWSYEKVGNEKVKCISAPRTEKEELIGVVYDFRLDGKLVKIL